MGTLTLRADDPRIEFHVSEDKVLYIKVNQHK